MKKLQYTARILILSLIAAFAIPLSSAKVKPAVTKGTMAQGQRQYTVTVSQTNDTVKMNQKMRRMNANRGILMDLASGYMTMGTSTLLQASKALLDLGVGAIKEASRDKRPDWQEAVNKESRFVKMLPMQTQVLDFYGRPSQNGALDPMDMKFNGFGCRQVVNIVDEEGYPHEEEVFYLSCRVRDDDAGIGRMLNHSKFEVVVDELRFNPYLCNLPNDSVNPNPDTRIAFSFDKRKDLMFNVDAVISSSWINEAIQVHDNVELGRFSITAAIDPEFVDADGVFRYDSKNPADAAKRVGVAGECFLVPRSYVGSADMLTAQDSWGTGQYKVDMVVAESCKINEDYYTAKNKNGKKEWKKEKWNPEWQLIKARKPRQNLLQTVTRTIVPQYSGEKWINTITEPFTATLIKHEGQWVNAAAADILQGAAPAAAAPAAAAPSSNSPKAPAGNTKR